MNDSGTPSTTPDDLYGRAVRAHERLYRLADADEPDLALNVTLVVGRARLLRLAAARSRTGGSAVFAAVEAYIDAAEQVSEPSTAAAWFSTFAEDVLDRLAGDPPVEAVRHVYLSARDEVEAPGQPFGSQSDPRRIVRAGR